MCVDVPESAAKTLEGFRAWASSASFPEHGRITYYRQRIFVDMSPEKANKHSKVKSEIARVLGNLVKERNLGELHHDGLWVTNDEADLSNEADATFISWESLESRRIQLIASSDDEDGIEMRGSPDWVLEVVSKSSEKKDKILLPEAYHKAKVREFWLVDAQGEQIDFKLSVWRPDTFEMIQPDDDGWRESEVFGCAVRLDRERNQVGGWSYTLLIRLTSQMRKKRPSPQKEDEGLKYHIRKAELFAASSRLSASQTTPVLGISHIVAATFNVARYENTEIAKPFRIRKAADKTTQASFPVFGRNFQCERWITFRV